MFCPNCGSQVPDGSSVCPSCGAQMSDYTGDDTMGLWQEAPDAGYSRGGYAQNGYGQGGYGQNGYGQGGYDPNGYGQNGYDLNGYGQGGYGQNGYDPNGYGQNGYDPNGYDPNGYSQGGYDANGYGQGSYSGEEIYGGGGAPAPKEPKRSSFKYLVAALLSLIGILAIVLVVLVMRGAGEPKTDPDSGPESVSSAEVRPEPESLAESAASAAESAASEITIEITATPAPESEPAAEPAIPTPEAETIYIEDPADTGGTIAESVDGVVYLADVYEYLTLRTEPNTKATPIALLPPYQQMYIIEYAASPMVKVRTISDQPLVGYVNRDYITAAGNSMQRAGKSKPEEKSSSSGGTIYYADVYDFLTLRSEASTSSSALAYIPPFGAMQSIEKSGKMIKVVVLETGMTGWVNGDYVVTDISKCKRAGKSQTSGSSSNIGDIYVVDANEWITLRESPSTKGNEIEKIPTGHFVVLLEKTTDDFWMVQAEDGNIGYVMCSYLDWYSS